MLLPIKLLDKIASVLKVPVVPIKNFDEQRANNFFNIFNDSSTGAFNNFMARLIPSTKSWNYMKGW